MRENQACIVVSVPIIVSVLKDEKKERKKPQWLEFREGAGQIAIELL